MITNRRRVVVLAVMLLLDVHCQSAFAQSFDTTRSPDIGFHLELGMGHNTLQSNALTMNLAAAYRRDEMMYTLCFSGHLSEFVILGESPLTISELGLMLGKIHSSDFTFWAYSGGFAVDFITRSSGGSWWNGTSAIHDNSLGAALIAQVQAGLTLYHVVGLCGTIYGSLNTSRPLIAFMLTLQIGYL